MLTFLIGLFAGTLMGFLLCGLLTVEARLNDQEEEELQTEFWQTEVKTRWR
jgi:hypothetical protein